MKINFYFIIRVINEDWPGCVHWLITHSLMSMQCSSHIKIHFFFLLYQMYILFFCHNLCSYLFLYLNFKSPECIYFSHMFNLEHTLPVFQIAFQVSPLSISLNSPSSQLWSPHLSLTLLSFRFSIFTPHVPILFPITSSLSISLCQWDMGVSRDWQLATDPISVTMETGSISR